MGGFEVTKGYREMIYYNLKKQRDKQTNRQRNRPVKETE